MKDYVIKNFDAFIEISKEIETPLKFYEVKDNGRIRAEIYCRTMMISWEGSKDAKTIMTLASNGFSEAELRETRKPLEDVFGG